MKLTRLQTFKDVHKGFFSRDGKRLALMSATSVDVIETATERKLFHLESGNTTFLGVSCSPDERLLAVACRLDGPRQTLIKISVWDVVAAQRNLTLPVEDDDWRR